MCDFNKPIKFCTCSPEELERETVYWELAKFISHNPHVRGRLAMGRDEIQGLTKEKVLEYLNSGKAFDFEYTPKSRDILYIIGEGSFRFMGFIFDNGTWRSGSAGFETYQTTHRGKIENLGPEITPQEG